MWRCRTIKSSIPPAPDFSTKGNWQADTDRKHVDYYDYYGVSPFLDADSDDSTTSADWHFPISRIATDGAGVRQLGCPEPIRPKMPEYSINAPQVGSSLERRFDHRRR